MNWKQNLSSKNFTEQIVMGIFFLVLIVLPIVAAIWGVTQIIQGTVSKTDWILFWIGYISTGLGITVGFHRMMVHQSFKTNPVIRAIFLALGCFTLEGPPSTWAAIHLKHHVFSDKDQDPHSPRHGFWHGHFGWLFSLGFNEIEKIHEEFGKVQRGDALIRFFDKTYLIWAFLGFAIPFWIGGFTGLVWGGFIRIFVVAHVTWSVNSVCHTFGKQAFATKEDSRNNFIVGVLALGEGWHNNHHAFPRSAFHGLKWWQIDLSSYIIRTLEKLKLVWDVQRVSEKDKELKQLGKAA